MTTVLFADRDGSALGALGERTVPALLPLRALPCLEHALTALVAAGHRSALCVVGPRAGEVQKRFGKGIRWGIALEYVRREDAESVGDVLRRLEARLDGDTLVLRGDMAAHGAVKEFLEAIRERREPVLAGTSGGRLAGLWRIAPAALKKIELPRDPAAADWTLGKDHAAVPLEAKVSFLDSVASYRAAEGDGKPEVSERAEVSAKATLGPGTAVAEEAVVLEGAKLARVAVLPRTVIPPGVALEDAVVSGNLVLKASGATERLTDQLPAAGKPLAGATAGSRVAGLLLFLLSLPLWPVAFFWALLANAGHAKRAVELVGTAPGRDANGRPARARFRTFRFETAVPVLRDLPLLLAVAAGRLALQGVAAAPAGEPAAQEEWEEARLEAPPALLARSRMVVPAGSPAEVSRLVDAFEARRGVPGIVGEAASRLFTAAAWTAPKEWKPDVLADGSTPTTRG